MTKEENEEIEKAAVEYADKCYDVRQDYSVWNSLERGFIAGAIFLHPEIDELKERIKSLEATIDCEVNMVQPRMQEQIDELLKVLKIPHLQEIGCEICKNRINKIIKKYENNK